MCLNKLLWNLMGVWFQKLCQTAVVDCMSLGSSVSEGLELE